MIKYINRRLKPLLVGGENDTGRNRMIGRMEAQVTQV